MIREMPVSEKPRERLLREGVQSLSTTEILAILIRTGTRNMSAMELAAATLALNPQGVRGLADATPEELRRIPGFGDAKICELLAAVELGKRIASAPKPSQASVRSPSDIAEMFMEKLRFCRKEHFYCLLINSKGQVIEETEVSVGDICSSVAHPREVFTSAVRRSAGAVALVHNHPSGDPEPSADDIATTERLAEAGRLMGIPVIDHIIIGDGTYTSLKDRGIL